MSDSTLLRERLESVLGALERIPRRFADIRSADDFSRSEEGQDRLDAICMGTLILMPKRSLAFAKLAFLS